MYILNSQGQKKRQSCRSETKFLWISINETSVYEITLSEQACAILRSGNKKLMDSDANLPLPPCVSLGDCRAIFRHSIEYTVNKEGNYMHFEYFLDTQNSLFRRLIWLVVVPIWWDKSWQELPVCHAREESCLIKTDTRSSRWICVVAIISVSFLQYWLDVEKQLNHQVGLSTHEPLLKFCVKFYTPDPSLIEEEYTRYLFGLQIKRDLAVGQLQCNDNTAALMASYIVQGKCNTFLYFQ